MNNMHQEVKNKELVGPKHEGESRFRIRASLTLTIIGVIIFILSVNALIVALYSKEGLLSNSREASLISFIFLYLLFILLGLWVFKKPYSKGLKIRYSIFVLLYILFYLFSACGSSEILFCDMLAFQPLGFIVIIIFYLSFLFSTLITLLPKSFSSDLLSFIPHLLTFFVLFFYIVIFPEIKSKPTVRIFIILGFIFLALNILLFLGNMMALGH